MKVLAFASILVLSSLIGTKNAHADWFICNNSVINTPPDGGYYTILVPTLVSGGCQKGNPELFHLASHDDLVNFTASLEKIWTDFPSSEIAKGIIKEISSSEVDEFKKAIEKKYEDRITRLEELVNQLQKSRK